MEHKSYECGPYNLHIIKTNNFKTIHMEIMFRSKVDEERMQKRTMISDLITDYSKKYKNKKDLVIRLEELYKMTFYGTTVRTGNVLSTIFISDFISPEYINEKNYLKEAISLPFEIILNPNVNNNEFDIKNFNLIKERLKMDIDSIEEIQAKKSIHNALKNAFPTSPTSKSVLGTTELLNEITPTNLYDEYLNMINNDLCDIFIIGNIDEETCEQLIKESFKLKTIKTHELKLYVDNEYQKRAKTITETSEFIQSGLDLIYNIETLNTYNKNIVFHVFNYIFGSGGITSKLYKYIREENSLCYAIYSMYLKYDRVLLVHISLDKNNIKKAIKLTKQALNEIIKGEFSEEDIENAKANIINSIEAKQDNIVSILNDYIFQTIDDLASYDERKKLIKQVSKKDIMNLAKRIKLNTIYQLNGGQDAKDRD